MRHFKNGKKTTSSSADLSFYFINLNAFTALIFPIEQIVHSPFKLLGIIFIIAGVILNLKTDKLFQQYKTTVKPHKKPQSFIKEGPFSLVRHPMYTGMITLVLGEAILLGSLSAFIPTLFFYAILNWKFIPLD